MGFRHFCIFVGGVQCGPRAEWPAKGKSRHHRDAGEPLVRQLLWSRCVPGDRCGDSKRTLTVRYPSSHRFGCRRNSAGTTSGLFGAKSIGLSRVGKHRCFPWWLIAYAIEDAQRSRSRIHCQVGAIDEQQSEAGHEPTYQVMAPFCPVRSRGWLE